MLTPERQLHLMTWLSPAFPVGAFSYSHGIEYAVECGLVTDKNTLEQWISGIMQFGSGLSDAILFAETWRTVTKNDIEYLMYLNEYAFAFRATNELALESSQQGQSFVDMQMAYNSSTIFQQLKLDSCSYPIAVAIAAAEQQIPLQEALVGYLHALASNLVSAGVRIIPLGQVAGLQVLSQINAEIPQIAERAINSSLADIGSSSPMVDWSSAQHENQYTRLFRS